MWSIGQLLDQAELVAGHEIELDRRSVIHVSTLLKSYSEVELSGLGRRIAFAELVRSAVNYQIWRALPSKSLSKPPIILLGLPRTGSTFLHNLFGQIAELRALKFYEALSVPGTELSGPSQAEVYLRQLYGLKPRLRVIHPLEAEGAEECVTAIQAAFFSERFAYLVPAFDYADYLRAAEDVDAYLMYASYLGALDPAARWVLKSPSHSFHLQALATAFPDATIVRLWRQPHEVAASFSSLAVSLAEMSTARVDSRGIAQYWTQAWADAASMLESLPSTSKVVDVDYEDLSTDPISVVERVCDLSGVVVSISDRQRLRSYVMENPKNKYGVHDYARLEATERIWNP